MTIKMPKTGLPLEEATTKDLEYWADRKEKEVSEGTSKYARRDSEDAAAMRVELKRRQAGGAQVTPPQSKAMAMAMVPAQRSEIEIVQQVAGSYVEARKADHALRLASANLHLVSPATSCGALRVGCEVQLSMVYVDVGPDSSEINSVGGGKFSLAGTVLRRIAAAAGVDWDDKRSDRKDDGTDSHYCDYLAVGWVKNFDGSKRRIMGRVEIDAREGSPQLEEIRQKAQARKPPSDGAAQILELRKFILRHAESKAKNRAVADLVKRSYTKEELSKPFAVAQLNFTGRSNDPETRRMFAEKIADSMLESKASLYGREEEPEHHHRIGSGHPPPPVGRVPADEDAYDTYGYSDPDPEPESDPQASAAPEADKPVQGTIPGTSASPPGGY